MSRYYVLGCKVAFTSYPTLASKASDEPKSAHATLLLNSTSRWRLRRGADRQRQLARQPPPNSSFRIAIALAPVVPVVFVLIAIMRLLVNSDELQQRIQLFAISFAAVTTALLTFSYGFLEGIGFPHLSPIWVFPLMTGLWGLSLSYFSRRYQ
jgi:hypothetical protein